MAGVALCPAATAPSAHWFADFPGSESEWMLMLGAEPVAVGVWGPHGGEGVPAMKLVVVEAPVSVADYAFHPWF